MPAATLAAAPAPRPPLPACDFAVYGDCRYNTGVHRKVCESIVATGARFVVVTGDLVDFGDSEEEWAEFREITKELRSKADYLAAPGNHDLYPQRLFEREFGLDRTYREKVVGDAHVFLLDSNQYFSDGEQLRWLEEQAAASTSRHKIAAFHHPPYSLDSWEGEEQRVRERIHALLVRLRFCAAFMGHHHSFYATRRDGLRYVVSAGGGAPLYPIEESKAIPGDLYRRFHHFVACRVSEKGVTARVFDPDGLEAPELAFEVCKH